MFAAASYKVSGRLMAIGTAPIAYAVTSYYYDHRDTFASRSKVECEAAAAAPASATVRLKSSTNAATSAAVNLRKRVRSNNLE
jgi:hypothetical protein